MSLGRASNMECLIKRASSLLRPNASVSALCSVQHRNLTSDPYKLEEIRAKRGKPWRFHRFPGICQFVDRAKKRLNENSKIIVIQGPMKIGKHELGKELARKFDMRFFPEVTCDDVFKLPTGLDLRSLNDQLPAWLQYIDFESFYKEPDPAKLAGMARTQIQLYIARFMQYADALSHLLNTGQGSVMVGGVFQEICYSKLLWRKGYFTREGYRYYRDLREHSLVELWKPHVIIHYDAPVGLLREKITERNAPGEVGSPVLTDEYIGALRTNIKENLLNYKSTVEQLKFDARGLDIDIVVEKLEKLNLTPDILFDEMLEDWNLKFTEDYDMYRMQITNQRWLKKLMGYPAPMTKTSRTTIMEEDLLTYEQVVLQHPDVMYAKGYAPTDSVRSHEWITP